MQASVPPKVWTAFRPFFAHVAVCAEDLITLRIVMFFEVSTNFVGCFLGAPVLVSATIDMVNDEKCEFRFTAACAFASVHFDDFETETSPRLFHLVTVVFPYGFRTHPRFPFATGLFGLFFVGSGVVE